MIRFSELCVVHYVHTRIPAGKVLRHGGNFYILINNQYMSSVTVGTFPRKYGAVHTSTKPKTRIVRAIPVCVGSASTCVLSCSKVRPFLTPCEYHPRTVINFG
jgi:hypothetical protein